MTPTRTGDLAPVPGVHPPGTDAPGVVLALHLGRPGGGRSDGADRADRADVIDLALLERVLDGLDRL